jgi:2-(3-amino-3-carboxypropyl)histidine synthase
MFDLRLGEITEWILSEKLSSVAVQLPEGLKMRALEIADGISSGTGIPVTVLGDPCYGACDVRAGHTDIADGLVHFGHSRMPSLPEDGKILFIEVFAKPKIDADIPKIADGLPERIGLLATVQYIEILNETKAVLEGRGKKVLIGKGDGRLMYDGQVLGCNCSAAEAVAGEVDCFLFLGEGDFHPLAAALGISKEIFVFNPLTSELRSVSDERDRMLRKRFAAIENSRSAGSFLIIVSGKIGQRRDAVADDMMEKITAAGRKAYKVFMDEIRPESLSVYGADAYINTACPRLATDDSMKFGKPVLTPPEAEIALGLRKWEDLEFDVIR